MAHIAVRLLCSFVFLSIFGIGECLSQIQPETEESPIIKLGKINFDVRTIGYSSSPLRILEVQIEVFNKSLKATAPPNSIMVVVTPKELTFSKQASQTEPAPGPQEVSIEPALPPSTGRIVIVGFSLPASKPKAITLVVQINPPDGETKTATWENSEQ